MSESGSLALFESFCATFAAMARLFELRAIKARNEALLEGVEDDDFLEGYAAAHGECAREIRDAVARLREP